MQELKPVSRISSLDGLRGFLALTVFFHHFLYCFAPAFITGGITPAQASSGELTAYHLVALTPLNAFMNPNLAVDFFFLLSGYVLSYGYFSGGNILPVQHNSIKRYFRLMVPVFASCILLWLLHKAGLIYRRSITITDINQNWLPGLLPDYLNFFEVVKYGALEVFGGNSRYNTVLWTMQTELLGSFIVFALLMATHQMSHHKKVFILLAALLLLLFFNKVLLSAFVAGMLICYACNTPGVLAQWLVKVPVKLFLFSGGLYLATFPFVSHKESIKHSLYAPLCFAQVDAWREYYYTTGVSLLLLVFVNSTLFNKLFSGKIFIFLGRISFSLYLIHLLVIFAVSSRVYEALYRYMYDVAGVPLTLVISTAVLLSVSWLFYRFVDVYAIKMASKIARFFWK